MRVSRLLLSAALLSTAAFAETPTGPARWEKDIAALEAKQKEQPTAPGSLLFVGSSSIRMWDLGASWPAEKTVNHGFGGSMLPDTVHFFDRLVVPLEPRAVIVYAGDNDIAAGKSPERVASDFAKLTERITKELPETRIAYIAIKPSLSRWNLADKMIEANRLIAQQCAKNEQLTMVDVWKPMLGADGKPRPELFGKDGLHLSKKGYELWTSLLKPIVQSKPAEDPPASREQ